jgi:hypothetical protein
LDIANLKQQFQAFATSRTMSYAFKLRAKDAFPQTEQHPVSLTDTQSSQQFWGSIRASSR